MLSNILWVEVRMAVFQVNSLLEQTSLLQIVVEAQDLDARWSLGSSSARVVPLDRGLKLVFVSELADGGGGRVGQLDGFRGVLGR